MTALAPALLIVFFIITLILGVQLISVNFIAGLLWLAAWGWLVYKTVELAGSLKTQESTGFNDPNCDTYVPPDNDPRTWY